jgi:phosphohistidine phosphatase SixA
MRVLLIRHAQAGKRNDSDPDDSQRPLTGAGRRRARALVTQFASFELSRVLSSPALRCQQTVEPLAAARQLPVEVSPELSEGTALPPVLELIGRASNAACCTHGDVVQNLIVDLHQRGIPIHGGSQWEKGSVWLLDLLAGTITQARYLPPA